MSNSATALTTVRFAHHCRPGVLYTSKFPVEYSPTATSAVSQLALFFNLFCVNSTQAEFHAHDDEVDLEDFCAIMERHQPENLVVKDSYAGSSDSGNDGLGGEGRAEGAGRGEGRGSGGTGAAGGGGKVVVSREEVVSNLVELFKEVRKPGRGKEISIECSLPRVEYGKRYMTVTIDAVHFPAT